MFSSYKKTLIRILQVGLFDLNQVISVSIYKLCTGIFLPEVLFCSFLTTFFFSEKVVWGTWQSATSSSLSFSLPRYRKLFLNSKTFVGNVIKTTATATNADVSDGNVGDDDNDDVGDNADMTTMTMTMTQ